MILIIPDVGIFARTTRRELCLKLQEIGLKCSRADIKFVIPYVTRELIKITLKSSLKQLYNLYHPITEEVIESKKYFRRYSRRVVEILRKLSKIYFNNIEDGLKMFAKELDSLVLSYGYREFYYASYILHILSRHLTKLKHIYFIKRFVQVLEQLRDEATSIPLIRMLDKYYEIINELILLSNKSLIQILDELSELIMKSILSIWEVECLKVCGSKTLEECHKFLENIGISYRHENGDLVLLAGIYLDIYISKIESSKDRIIVITCDRRFNEKLKRFINHVRMSLGYSLPIESIYIRPANDVQG